ncbi:MAG: PaaI family thioesterase [Myxococcota bacterium]
MLRMMMSDQSLQERFAPSSICFGCGPVNQKGLRIRSFEQGDALVCEWTPQKHHEAFPGMLNGGIVGSLLDCHSNWTAAVHLMKRRKLEQPPVTVTADYAVSLKRPCPSDKPLTMKARVVESADPRVVVEATLESDGKVRATCRGTFIAVEPGHPAYHRW